MYAKIQLPNGSWQIHEAKKIEFSSEPELLEPQDGARCPVMWDPFIPIKFQEIFEAHMPSINDEKVESISWQKNLVYDLKPKAIAPNNPGEYEVVWSIAGDSYGTGAMYCKLIYCDPEDKQGFNIPKAWIGQPQYSYVILDDAKAVVFPTTAFVMNDDGKTIAKVG